MERMITRPTLSTLFQFIYLINTIYAFLTPESHFHSHFSFSLSNNGNDAEPKQSNNASCIPIIGPLFNKAPLIIGASLWLDPPTPLQWKTIEVCVDTLTTESNGVQERNAIIGNSAFPNMATIDAAPLVAVLQEDSDFATIAAIVGYKSAVLDDEGASQLDTFDSTSLRESLAGLSTTPFYKDGTKVRLLGIGRAKLFDFYAYEADEGNEYEADEKLQFESQATASSAISTSSNNASGVEDEYEKGLIDEACDSRNSVREPVLMARMTLILDGLLKPDEKDEYSRYSSPVHLVNKLSMWASRIAFLHEDRQKLVQSLHAATSRLEILSNQLEDLDGIGDLFQEQCEAIDRPPLSTKNCWGSQHSTSLMVSNEAARLLEIDNFGMGSTSSAYSALNAMSRVLTERLQIYYSPERVDTEEFEYSMFSWVALQSLMDFLPKSSIQLAMSSTNSVERMSMLYDAMCSHKELLLELVRAKEQELRACGEECDLF